VVSFLVPRLGFLVVIGLAITLIGVVLRSPDTHANLWTQVDPTYARTEVAQLSGEMTTEAHPAGISLFVPSLSWQAALPADPGKQVFLRAGCGMCHGIDALGGPVAPLIAGSSLETVKHMVREAPGGMPAYAQGALSDSDLEAMAGYLAGLPGSNPPIDELSTLADLTYNPSVPLDVLLKGKAAIRRSCGACHTQPTREEILSEFSSDYVATHRTAKMVQNAKLSLEDGKAVANYILAVIHGADPVKEP